MTTRKFNLEYVDNIPEHLKEGILYVSMKYHTTAHLCACGCGERVVNPLNRKYGWVLTFDGQRVSLSPSIGNYQFPCHSHYYIKDNEVIFLDVDERDLHYKGYVYRIIEWIKHLLR